MTKNIHIGGDVIPFVENLVKEAESRPERPQVKIDLTDWLGGEYRDDYSGRGMFGKICDAWEYESEQEAVKDMMIALVGTDEDDAEALYQIFKGYQIDSMGRGVVLYFPRYKGAIA